MKKIILIKLIVFSLIMGGCGNGTETKEESHDDHDEEPSNEVVLTEEQIRMGDIVVTQV